MKIQQLASLKKSFVYPARTTIAAVLALLVARMVGLPEFYWAGALLLAHFEPSATVFGFGVLGVGLLSAALRLDHPANRIAAIALAIVFLIVRTQPAWMVALHRFLEVSTGIVVGLLLSALWPEQETINHCQKPR